MSREDLVRSVVAAVNARDADAYIACCTANVELHSPISPLHGVHEGPDGIRRFLAEIEEAGPDFHLEIERLELVGDRALAFVLASASGRTSGVALSREVGNVYEFEGDRIRRVRIYGERDDALREVGL
ncbi:MAG: nuclear transport factor 2 family protein [Thermoleophilaceae bacterium]